MHTEEAACNPEDNCSAFKHWYDWVLVPFAPFIALYYMATGRL